VPNSLLDANPVPIDVECPAAGIPFDASNYVEQISAETIV